MTLALFEHNAPNTVRELVRNRRPGMDHKGKIKYILCGPLHPLALKKQGAGDKASVE